MGHWAGDDDPAALDMRAEVTEPRPTARQEVVITGVDAPFWQLVELFIRCFFAALVAALLVSPILFVLAFGAMMALGVLGAMLGGG